MDNIRMITFEEALDKIREIRVSLTGEEVALERSLSRILALPVMADADMPPFNKSAMDGYACRRSDLQGDLKVIEELPAGKVPEHIIARGECAKIMTGAMVPDGADFILMKEHAEITGEQMVRRIISSENDNICHAGEDIRKGDVVLQAGVRIQPAHIAVMAAVGCTGPNVYQLPRTAVISTGNELIEPEYNLMPGKIRNSNGYQLTSQAVKYGLSPDYLGIICDDRKKLTETLSANLEKYSLIMISGGVSVGDYDYIPEVLSSLGLQIIFHGLRVKPGKHFLLGVRDNHFVAGMPGNPVSSFVMFEVLLKPLLNKLMGINEETHPLKMCLETNYSRKKNDTLFFIPVSFTREGCVLPLEYHGSAHIQAYTQAQGIMQVPIGTSEIKRGDFVYVRPI